MFTRALVILAATLCASAASAQSTPSNTVTLSGPTGADCPEIVAGQINMPDIIEQAGGAEKLYELSQSQLAEYDRWFTEMEAARGQGIREAEIEALIAQGRTAQDVERQLSEAALCYMGQ